MVYYHIQLSFIQVKAEAEVEAEAAEAEAEQESTAKATAIATQEVVSTLQVFTLENRLSCLIN